MRSSALLSLVAALPPAYGVAFGGPEPTAVSPNRALDGTSPRPTRGPSVNELRKRQSSPATCGWADGDFSSALTCNNGRTCMLYKSAASGMVGCCDGSDTQNCGWVRSCVNYSRYVAGDCGSSCLLDSFVTKCTNEAAPYCATYTYVSEGIADYVCDSTSTNAALTILQTATDYLGSSTRTRLPTLAAGAISTGAIDATTQRRVKKLAIGAIVGIVIAILFIVFFVIIGVVMCMKKKKKQKQIAANAQIIANVQGNRPQSQVQPTLPQMQQGPPPPMPTQSPQPTVNGYFPPQTQQEQKYNGHTSIHEYAMSPISNPSTPAPAYAQPYMAPSAPPMPQQPSGQYQPPANGAHEVASPVLQQHTGQYQAPMNGAHEVASPNMSQPHTQQQAFSSTHQYSGSPVGAHEVDAISVPHAPGKTGPVYEMGQGR